MCSVAAREIAGLEGLPIKCYLSISARHGMATHVGQANAARQAKGLTHRQPLQTPSIRGLAGLKETRQQPEPAASCLPGQQVYFEPWLREDAIANSELLGCFTSMSRPSRRARIRRDGAIVSVDRLRQLNLRGYRLAEIPDIATRIIEVLYSRQRCFRTTSASGRRLERVKGRAQLAKSSWIFALVRNLPSSSRRHGPTPEVSST